MVPAPVVPASPPGKSLADTASLLGAGVPQPGAEGISNPGTAAGHGCATSPGTTPDGDSAAGQAGRTDGSRSSPAAAGRHRRPGQQNTADPQLAAKREIRVLWAAQLVSCAGDQFGRVAIAVMVYGQSRSPLLTAVAYALTYLPPLIGGHSILRLTGRFSRRTLMIVLDVARAALVATIALRGEHLWSLFALLLAAMLLGSLFSAARAALVRDRAPAGAAGTGAAGAGTGAGAAGAGTAGQAQAIGTIGYQAGQALGFLAGAGLVATLQPRLTLLIDALTFLTSACLAAMLVRRRPAPAPPCPHAEPATGIGARTLARSTMLRTLALLGWLAGFYVVPECLAAPYARALGGGALTVGLLMAAMPAGAVLGVVAFSRLIRPPEQEQLLGWLAMLSCVPLIFSALHPPLGAVLALWALAGMATAYQLGALVAFIRTLADQRPSSAAGPDRYPSDAASGPGEEAGLPSPAWADGQKAGVLGFAQAGLAAAQCLGFVVAGAAAQLVGPQAAVALAGLSGLAASAILTRMWRRAHTGRMSSCTLARGAAGRGTASGDC